MQIEQIKPDATIKVDFSPAFYQRLQQVVIHMTENIAPEMLTASFQKMKDEAELTEQETDLQTILILIQTLEINARAQDLVEMVEVPDVVAPAEPIEEAEQV